MLYYSTYRFVIVSTKLSTLIIHGYSLTIFKSLLGKFMYSIYDLILVTLCIFFQ